MTANPVVATRQVRCVSGFDQTSPVKVQTASPVGILIREQKSDAAIDRRAGFGRRAVGGRQDFLQRQKCQ
jgi:hypothetical protein